jgi:hypothetical protein
MDTFNGGGLLGVNGIVPDCSIVKLGMVLASFRREAI